jgi:integrase
VPRYAPRKLTEGFIESLPLGEPVLVRDTDVTGLMVAVNRKCVTYKVQRDLWRDGAVKTVRRTLGSTKDMSLKKARLEAVEIIQKIKRGIDPNELVAVASVTEQRADCWTVGQMFDKYAANLRKRECAEKTVLDTLASIDRHLSAWREIPINKITRTMVLAKHDELSERGHKVLANRVMRDFRAAYNLALKSCDDDHQLRANPIGAITFNKERRKDAVIEPDDLPAWWLKISKLRNPLRRLMHELGLFSGLRPGTLVSLRREWIKLDRRTICIPKMKSGRSFDLPLSNHMMQIVQRALVAGDVNFPGTEWLFPTNTNKPNETVGDADRVIATQVWREDTLPSETGHILRHTYRTIAQREHVNTTEARLLLDHTVPGIDGVYIHERALFDRLLAAQEVMSAAILALLAAKPGKETAE